MATRKDSISLRIKTVVEGLKDIDKLVAQIDTLGGESAETSDEVKALNREFAQLQKQQRTIDEFNRLDASIAKTERDLAKAKDRASEVAEKFTAATKPTKALTREYERAANTQNRLEQEQKAQLRTLDGLTNRMKAAGVDTGRLTAEQVRLNAAMSKVSGQSNELAGKLKTTRDELRATEKSTKDTTSGFSKLSAGVGKLGGALRFIGVAAIAGWFKNAAVGADTLKRSLAAVTGDAQSAAKEFDWLRQVSGKLGLPVQEAGKAYLNLAAAAKGTALEGQATRDIFEAVSRSMAVLGKSSDDTNGALLALSQMISKGKVSAEELRGQLGERLPGAFQAAARAVGVTTEELENMLMAGNLTAEELLPKLANELNRLYDTGEEIQTFGASWERLKGSIEGAFTSMNESAGIMSILGGFLEGLGSVLSLATLGFVTLAEKAKAAAKSAASFWQAISTSKTFSEALKEHNDAWAEAEANIAKAADTAFNADVNLSALKETTKKVAKETKEQSAEAKKLADENERLAQKLAEISILEEKGVITAQAAALQKQEVAAQLQALNASTQQAVLTEEQLAKANKETTKAYIEKIQAETSGEKVSELLSTAAKQLGNDVNSVAQVSSAAAAQITKLAEAETKAKGSTVELADNLLELAAQYRLGEISAAQYWEQTKKITEEAKANKSAADDTSAALKEVGSAAETAGQQMAEGGGGGSDIMRARMEAARDAMSELSEAASEVFESLVKVINKSHATTRDFTNAIAAGNPEIAEMEAEVAALSDELGRLRQAHILAAGEASKWLNSVAIAAVTVKREYLEQSLAAERLAARVKGLDTANIQQLNSLERTINGFNLLDESDLSGIRGEISRLRSEQEALNGSIETTLRSLQDEFDSLNDNQAGIELRDFQDKLKQLQDQIKEAQAANNSAAVTSAQEAMKILQQVHNQKMANIRKEQEAERSQSNTGERQQTTTTPDRTVRIEFTNPATGQNAVGVFPANQETDVLQMLESARGVAG